MAKQVLHSWIARKIGMRGLANKYNAKPQTIDGVRFASTAEANRYCILKLMEKAGEIYGLTPHPRFSLVVNGKLIGHYTADASYFRGKQRVVEDTKSDITRKGEAYRLRAKLFCALYPRIQFVEISNARPRKSLRVAA